MSKENVRLFYEKIKSDEALQERFTNEIEMHPEKLPDSLIELATEYGFSFNEEDLKAFSEETVSALHKNGELSDEEMAKVSGGYSRIIIPW